MATEKAIIVRDAKKRYGSSIKVLDGLNMTVLKGSIYGLLGASGCGKTTLLSCVVGVRRLDSGEIWVLGGPSGSKGSGIPGPRVGYMPQDISLVQEFTVIGALYYFGKINGLEDYEIEERHVSLSKLLQLPPKDHLVKNMSGGQQRRVSFAAALIHKPELLILDEPTVGLDPVLRDNIWEHLVKITREEGTTIVITTHYIEEAKSADRIGLMRCGQLLAEATPNQLLARFQCQTLEEAFLNLSQLQKDSQSRGIMNIPTIVGTEMNEDTAVTVVPRANQNRQDAKYEERQSRMEKERRPRCCAYRKFEALMIKNMLQFVRHPGGLMFAFVLPIVQVIAFFLSIGGDPKGIYIGIVNQEAGNCNYGETSGKIIYSAENDTCDFVNLSCRFIREYGDTIAIQKFYDDISEAHDAIRHGEVVAAMYFERNFSKALQSRIDDMSSASEDDIVAGEIRVWLDMGNRQIGLYVQKGLFERFFDIQQEIVRECDIRPKVFNSPIQFEEPVFGTKDQNYRTFVAPAFILSLVFTLATSVSSSIIISDRHAGIWDRSLVQGVSTFEILMSHMLTQLIVIIIQVSVSLCITFLHFGLECKGSMAAVISMVFLTGICGLCYGFLISVVCSNHTTANYISTGSFYPMILLCGGVWPIEGMPKFLRWLSLTLPTTLPGISLRDILDKGYSVNDPQVYNSYLLLAGWLVILTCLSLFGLRAKAV